MQSGQHGRLTQEQEFQVKGHDNDEQLWEPMKVVGHKVKK
jgi:hypothetical protein